MRNILALVAAFTLSTSSAITAVACGSNSGTTVKIFDWNKVINDSAGWTSQKLLQFLLSNTNNGIGQGLYKDVVNYVSLSILKTDQTFAADRAFAEITVTNQLKNEQDSLKIKYGRSWESKWKDILKNPSNGGDGKTGSYSRYFDSKLKDIATGIITQHYVTNNYNNYQYYEQSSIQLWLQDLFGYAKPPGITPSKDQIKVNIEKYIADSTSAYGNLVWIIAKANNPNFDQTANPPDYTSLAQAIFDAKSYAEVDVTNQVPITPGNDRKSNDYVIDNNPANAIKGLLSTQQSNIAKLWMKNQGPIWTRQIVIKFNDTVKDPLTKPITAEQFKDNMTPIINVLKDINSPGGFYTALDNFSKHNIAKATSSSDAGDLGLNVYLNADKTKIKPAFSYYVNRYVTSSQGVGNVNPTVAPFNLSEYKTANLDNPTADDVAKLIAAIDRQYNNGKAADGDTSLAGVLKQSSQYRDQVIMKDGTNSPTIFSGVNGNNVTIFIDEDGLHFVQTPGIAYQPKASSGTLQNIITNFNALLKKKGQITWDQAEVVANRPGGLSSNPYLDYLQTEFLRSTSNDTSGTGAGVYFDLNSSLKTFVTDSSQALNSKNWWDYILYFNNSIEKINWNISNTGLSTMLGTNITASGDVVNKFTQTLKNWFENTYNQRWNSLQGISTTDSLKNNLNGWNDDLDKNTSLTVTPARLDTDDLISFITNVAAYSIWWYDPNSIKN